MLLQKVLVVQEKRLSRRWHVRSSSWPQTGAEITCANVMKNIYLLTKPSDQQFGTKSMIFKQGPGLCSGMTHHRSPVPEMQEGSWGRSLKACPSGSLGGSADEATALGQVTILGPGVESVSSSCSAGVWSFLCPSPCLCSISLKYIKYILKM